MVPPRSLSGQLHLRALQWSKRVIKNSAKDYGSITNLYLLGQLFELSYCKPQLPKYTIGHQKKTR